MTNSPSCRGNLLLWSLWHPRPDVADVQCLAIVDGVERQLQLHQAGDVIFSEPVGPGLTVTDRAMLLRIRFEAQGFVSYDVRPKMSRPGDVRVCSSQATVAVKARLMAVTDEARRALGADYVVLKHLPFRIGREARLGVPTAVDLERRLGVAPPTNDLYLVERAGHAPFQISRQHFRVERDPPDFVVVDCGSERGTIVAGVALRPGGRALLRDLDVVILGSLNSPYVFKFRV